MDRNWLQSCFCVIYCQNKNRPSLIHGWLELGSLQRAALWRINSFSFFFYFSTSSSIRYGSFFLPKQYFVIKNRLAYNHSLIQIRCRFPSERILLGQNHERPAWLRSGSGHGVRQKQENDYCETGRGGRHTVSFPGMKYCSRK